MKEAPSKKKHQNNTNIPTFLGLPSAVATEQYSFAI